MGKQLVDKRVSVCIVSYNSAADIKKCLESFYKTQQSKIIQYDIYISDNQSNDNIAEMLRDRFPKVGFISNERNGGFGYGHNTVLSMLKSDYHIVLNPDIIFQEKDVIAGLANYMDEHPEVAVIAPTLKNTDGTIQYVPRLYPKVRYVLSSRMPRLFGKYRAVYTLENNYPTEPQEVEICSGSFMMVRTEDFKQVNGFDDRFFMYFEDFDISLRLRKFGKIILHPGFTVIHKWNRDSMKSEKQYKIQKQSMIKFYKKWLFRSIG